MYRFLLTRRWLGLLVVALVVAAACVLLGRWQLDRLQQRHARNDVINANLHAPPVPPDQVLGVDRPVDDGDEWTAVRANGRYDVARQLLVRNRPFEGANGYHVLTPLVTDSGTGILVDRGWVQAGESASDVPEVRPPPTGPVTVVGRLRASEPPSDGAAPPPGQVTRIDSTGIARTLPYDIYGGYVELVSQQPRDRGPGPQLTLLPEPEPTEGPHLAYAFQWFLFAALALGGYVVLARREARDPATPAPTPRVPAGVDR